MGYRSDVLMIVKSEELVKEINDFCELNAEYKHVFKLLLERKDLHSLNFSMSKTALILEVTGWKWYDNAVTKTIEAFYEYVKTNSEGIYLVIGEDIGDVDYSAWNKSIVPTDLWERVTVYPVAYSVDHDLVDSIYENSLTADEVLER